MSYTLHYAPDNASLIIRLTLEELGVPYVTQLVDRKARAQDSVAYRALNPAGLIPVLETPHGPVFETGAIVLWLADTHGRMAPSIDAPLRADYLKWLFFISNTFHPMLRMTFYPEKYAGPNMDAQRALRAHLQSPCDEAMTLPAALARIDARLSGGPAWPWGDGPTGIEYYVACLVRWCALYPVGQTAWFQRDLYPAIHAMLTRLEGRAAVRAAQDAEGLGPYPFTAPIHATPKEGSAT